MGLTLIIVGGIILTCGDIIMKNWTITNSNLTFINGILVWLLGLVLLAFSFKYKDIAVASMIFVIANIITLAIVNWGYYNESLSLLKVVGILIGFVAVVILEL